MTDKMNLQRTIQGIFLAILVIVLTASSAKKPKILIIGDSISIGYTPFVKKYFTDKAIVMHNPGNADHTGKGLQKIREYLGNEDWDIIQFNWGLHDLCYRHPESKSAGNRDKVHGRITFSVDEYKANLDSLVRIMKEISDARLIFVTTTYVPECEPGRFAKDPIIYNKAAKEVMKKHSVLINDIYKKSISIHKKYGIGNDDVHYTDKGNENLSKLIIDFLENEMERMKL
jgi:lysophospholipase L1-like esterase